MILRDLFTKTRIGTGRHARVLIILLIVVCVMIVASSSASAAIIAPSPSWAIQSSASPTNFTPGDETGLDQYAVYITNSGNEPTDRSPITITDTLPAGLTVQHITLETPRGTAVDIAPDGCHTDENNETATITCEVTETLA